MFMEFTNLEEMKDVVEQSLCLDVILDEIENYLDTDTLEEIYRDIINDYDLDYIESDEE